MALEGEATVIHFHCRSLCVPLRFSVTEPFPIGKHLLPDGGFVTHWVKEAEFYFEAEVRYMES